ncbi:MULTISPECIES: hypothetical protein [Mycobacteriales]|uniref:hypothetical protein n=1 Tax=unclassified Nocardia TaxID=2637762 RepID=UPI00367F1B94
MDRDLLPWPAGFGSERPGYPMVAVIAGFFVPGTLLFLSGVFSAVGESDPLLAVFCGAGALMCGSGLFVLPVFLRVRRRRVPRMTITQEPAMYLPARRSALIAPLGLVLGGSLWTSCVLVLVLTVQEPNRELDHVWNYCVLLAGLALSGLGVYGGWTIARWLRYRLGVRLGPEGLAVESGFTHQTTSWDDIAAIVPTEENRHRVVVVHSRDLVTVRRTRLVRRGGATAGQIRVNATAHRIDPALLYHLLQFYRADADRRRELGTETGLDRVQAGELGGA